MVTGEHPFQGEHPMAVMYAIKTEQPKPIASASQVYPAGLQETLERAFQKDPDNRFQTAAEFRAALLALLPDNAGAATTGPSTMRLGLIAGAIAVVVIAIGLSAWKVIDGRRDANNRTIAVTYNEQGMLKLGQGDLDGAEADLRSAVLADESYHVSWHNLALLAERRGDMAEADSLFHRAIALDPHYAPPHFQLGVMHHDAGELEEAESHYRDAIAADPTFLAAYNNLAAILIQQGRYDEAASILDAALARQPTSRERDVYARMLDKRGKVAEAGGDSLAAREYFDRAAEMKPQE
jgi:Tfp pilus assembly protein PilF